MVSKFSEVLYSLFADLWLTAPLASSQEATEFSIRAKPQFIPCPYTVDLVLIVIQHLSITGLFEKIQPIEKQNTFLLANQHKMYSFIKKPLYNYLTTTFTSYIYQFETPIFSQVPQSYSIIHKILLFRYWIYGAPLSSRGNFKQNFCLL